MEHDGYTASAESDSADQRPATTIAPVVLSPSMYFDTRVLDAERRHVFESSWTLVNDVTDLTDAGDYLAEFVGEQPVLILRDDDGRLRCFSNVCRHRGCTLVEGSGNLRGSIVCPYHNWSYDLHGALRGVPFRGEFECDLDDDRLGLHEIPMEVWERFAFVNLSGTAPPLAECLAPFADELTSHRISQMRRLNTIDEVRYGNWKVHVDNAYCAYHFAMVHPKTLYPSQSRTGMTTELSEYVGCAYIPWTGMDDSTDNPWGICGRAGRGSLNIALFPNLFLGALPNGRLTVLEWTPVTVDSTRLRAWSFGFATDEEAATEPERQRRVLDEDFEVVRRTHDGLRAPLFGQPGPRHGRELRISNFHRRLLHLLGSELDGSAASEQTDPQLTR